MRPMISLLLPVAVAVFATGQACAQHGGGGGHAGGISPAQGFHSGIGPRSSTYPAVSTQSSGSFSRGSLSGMAGTERFMPQNSYGMNGYSNRAADGGMRHEHPDRDRRGPRPYVYGYGNYLGPNFVGYPFGFDPGFYADDSDQSEPNSAPQPDVSADQGPENYAAEPPPSPPLEEAQGAGDTYRPPYTGLVSTEPARPQPVTVLVFKDGRPNQEVHNYVLTGTTLYDLDGDTRKDFPLSEINVPATVETNRTAGVDFTLPQAANASPIAPPNSSW